MHIDYISDIHSDFFIPKFKKVFGRVLKKTSDSKILIIAGDISTDIDITKKTIDELIEQYLYEGVFIVLWNHDLWYNKKDKDMWINNSIDKYHFLIEELHGYKNVVHCLDKENYFFHDEKVALVWNSGWYNYTINPLDKKNLEKYFSADFDSMRFRYAETNDRNYIKFNDVIKNNLEFAKYFEKDLILKLKSVRQNKKTKDYKIACVCHMKPNSKIENDSIYFKNYNKKDWEDILSDKEKAIYTYDIPWLFMNWFYVNSNISKIYEKFNVHIWIYWHTHCSGIYKYKGINYVTNAFWYINQITSYKIKTIEI